MESAGKSCFIAMPIATRPEHVSTYGDDQHWKHVMEHLFVPAIEKAGYTAICPTTEGSSMIHAEIVKHLSQADIVLCDLSSHNPNVFFELGVRTSLDLPVALVRDSETDIPFDLGGMNIHRYGSSLDVWSIAQQTSDLVKHLESAASSCGGSNPLWQRFGLSIRAAEPTTDETPIEAKLDLLISQTAPRRLKHPASAQLKLSKQDTFQIPGLFVDRPAADIPPSALQRMGVWKALESRLAPYSLVSTTSTGNTSFEAVVQQNAPESFLLGVAEEMQEAYGVEIQFVYDSTS